MIEGRTVANLPAGMGVSQVDPWPSPDRLVSESGGPFPDIFLARRFEWRYNLKRLLNLIA